MHTRLISRAEDHAATDYRRVQLNEFAKDITSAEQFTHLEADEASTWLRAKDAVPFQTDAVGALLDAVTGDAIGRAERLNELLHRVLTGVMADDLIELRDLLRAYLIDECKRDIRLQLEASFEIEQRAAEAERGESRRRERSPIEDAAWHAGVASRGPI